MERMRVLQGHGAGADNREDAQYQHPTSASHRSRRSRRLGLLDFRYCQRGLVVRANLKDGMSRAHRADVWPRCADDPATLPCLIACRMGQGLLVVEHRAEIAHVDAAFKEVKLNPLA